ncbi:MAG: ACP phosphodiesterase, partial [Candidatus Competibacteraceae bacterium]|nr:ACP phosphodiesterase [Candidatus Competibacteraceae bacterium]
MNYLAHFYLAGTEPQALIGSMLGDFAKGRIDDTFPPVIRQAIIQHRQIDVFTDAHPIVNRSKQRLGPGLRRFAGILVDVYYDHLLARNWPCYADTPLRSFVDRVYRVLRTHYADFPVPMQRSVTYMLSTDLLHSYIDLQGIRQALTGISGRLRRANPIAEAVTVLEQQDAGLATDFAVFFPDLSAHHSATQSSPSDK